MRELPLADSYLLGERLDDGGTNEVYAAVCRGLPGRVAIKLLVRALGAGAQAAEACRQDAALVARLGHPHVALVLAFGTTPDRVPFVVREHLEGETLQVQLARRGRLPLPEVVGIVKGAAAALAAAHAAGVVHGELRPEKVFLADTAGYGGGFVKLLDFGLRQLSGDRRGPGAMAAAARFTAPELLDSGRAAEVDGRADQFALAAITYRMVAGVDAFRGDDVAAVIRRVEGERPAPIAVKVPCDPRVDAVIRRGLARDPRQRFATVLAFAAALEEASRRRPDVTQTISDAEILEVRALAPSAATGGGEPGARSPLARASAGPPPLPAVRDDLDEISAAYHTDCEVLFAAREVDELSASHRAALARLPRERKARVAILGAILVAGIAAAWGTGWQPPAEWQLESLLDTVVRFASR